MRNIEQLVKDVPLETFEPYFRIHNYKDCIKHFELSNNEYKILYKHYGIVKTKEDIQKTKEQTCLERFGMKNPFDNISQAIEIAKNRMDNLFSTITKEELQDFYFHHSQKETIEKYKITEKEFYKLIDTYGLRKDKNTRYNILTEQYNAKVGINQEIIDLIRKDYIINNLTQQEIISKYNISQATLNRIIRQNNLYKPQELHIKNIENTFIKKYGVKNCAQLSEVEEKKKRTNLERYGVDNYFKTPEILKSLNRNLTNTSIERRFEEFLKNNKLDYIHQYVVFNKDKTLRHSFDFAIFKDGELDILVDTDGLYFHQYGFDQNINNVSYTDAYRSLLVPEGVKFYTVIEQHEEECYKEILKLINIDYDKYIEDVFNWCRRYDFPYPNIQEKEMLRSYNSLIKADCNNFRINSRIGEKVILAYHKSVWEANKKGQPSPYNAWHDDKILKKCIKNRIIYKGNQLDPSKVLAGLSVTRKASRVSIFNPYLAKYLINKYLNKYETIFDCCSGYSGRLLGTCSLNKKYIGQDINPRVVNESNQIINKLNLDANIVVKNSLENKGQYNCLFTCPPYSNKENWNQKIKDLTCDQWITNILENYKCETYLFVVDDTIKYKDYVVETLTNKSHFSTNNEYVILINKNK